MSTGLRRLVASARYTFDADQKLFNNSVYKLKEVTRDQCLRLRSRSRRPGRRNSDFKQNERRTIDGTGENFKEEKKQESNTLKAIYKIPEGISCPWLDRGILSVLGSAFKGLLPAITEMVSPQDVSDSDNVACRQYSASGKRLRNSLWPLFGYACIAAAQHMGFYRGDNEKKFSVNKLSSVIKDTANNSHSGFPAYSKKNLEAAFKPAFDWLRNVLNRPNFKNVIGPMSGFNFTIKTDEPVERIMLEMLSHPTLLFHRFQIKVNEIENLAKFSIRQVWCVPYHLIMLENYLFKNVVEHVKKISSTSNFPSYSTGLTQRQIRMRQIQPLQRVLKKYPHLSGVSTDYVKFDRNIEAFAFDFFFGIMEESIELREQEKVLLGLLRLYHKFTPYLRDGEFKFQTKGVVSGSYLTNFIDTWYNLTLWYFADALKRNYPELCQDLIDGKDNLQTTKVCFYAMYEATYNQICSILVCGDDTLFACTLYDIVIHKIVCNVVGINVKIKNDTKDGGDLFYLGRYWDSEGRPYNSYKYMAAHIAYRTTYYSESKLPFKDLSNLQLYRILSICLPLRDGLRFLNEYCKDWEPYTNWIKQKRPMWYLADWPSSDYEFLSYNEAINPDRY